jgi:membrane protein YdbS with pleckstrin-like domain
MTDVVRPEPTNPLPASVRDMWLWESVGAVGALIGMAFGLAGIVAALMPWLPVAIAALGLAYVGVFPVRRHRRYRWELRAEELDLLDGVYSVTRTIVPITRVQHVSVERTGWTDLFELLRVHVHTAAGKTTIPGLRRSQADDLRDRILAQLHTPDDL